MAAESMKQGESMEVEVIRAPGPVATPAEPAVEAQVAANVRLDQLAKAAQLLPEFLTTGTPSRPVAHNPKFWLYRAICVRNGWNEHTQITQAEFDAAVKAVANFTV